MKNIFLFFAWMLFYLYLPNVNANNTILLNEDFETGYVDGWTDNTLKETYTGDNYLGGFGSTRRVTADTEKTFSLPNEVTNVDITFDFLEIDSWMANIFMPT